MEYSPRHPKLSYDLCQMCICQDFLRQMCVTISTRLWLVCGLVKFVPAVAYHFCLTLSAASLQPRTSHKQVLSN